VSGTGKKRHMRSRGSWRGGRLLGVASDAAGRDQSGSELAQTPLLGAHGRGTLRVWCDRHGRLPPSRL
jgi:hypothetical protein